MSKGQLRYQIIQASQMINDNVTEERIQDHNKDLYFRNMSRSIATGHLSNFMESKHHLDTEFPNFDYRKEYQQKDPENNTMLHNACLNQRFVIVKTLLLNGFSDNINSRNKYGYTPLHNLTMNICINQKFNQDLFDLLIQNGADLLLKDNQNRTILDIIQQFGVKFAGTDYMFKLYQEKKTRESRLNFLYCISQSTRNSEHLKQLNFYEKLGIMKYM